MTSLSTPTQSSSLQIGDYLCMNGDRPCKIVNKTTSKTGKHGGAKIHFTCIDIFTDKKYEHLLMSTQNADVPTVTKNDYQLLSIDGNDVSYLDDKGNDMSDLVMPNLCEKDIELDQNLRNAFENGDENGDEIYIQVISAMNITAIKGFRVIK